jgi:hypothetical protein
MVLVDCACRHDGRLSVQGECHEMLGMRKGQPLKLWAVYKIGKSGKRLGSVQAATEQEALEEAYKEFAKTESERKRIYLRAQ